MSEITTFLKSLSEGQNLTTEEAARAFQIIMLGGATPAQIAAFLMALRMKGETIEEITGASMAMRTRSGKIKSPPHALDTCGTGGDNSGVLNISTAVAFVVAACGIPVAKHGNRAVSSKSGSADVLASLGVNVEAPEILVEESLREANICFMMAPKFHMAMRHVAPIRAELGIRTIFNLLGPLCNPASTEHHLMGVYDRRWVEPIAHVLLRLGSKAAWVVHGEDGMDELTTTGISHVAELKDQTIRYFEITPEDAGLPRTTIENLLGGEASYNARRLREVLSGEEGPYRDIVLLNAAAALIVGGKVTDLREGIAMASEAIDSGRAKQVLLKLVEISNRTLLSTI